MNATSTCPSPMSLQEYLLGRMSEAVAADVEQHLASCPECRKRLPAIQAEDDFVADFRAHAGRPQPKDILLDRLVGGLRGLLCGLPTGRDATPPADGALTPSAGTPSVSPLETTQEKCLSLAPSRRPEEIRRLGAYRIVAELGHGGMGTVHKAEDLKLRRFVALKVMMPSLAADAASRQRFLREAQAMAAIRHDHVVTIFQVGEHNGVPFLAMEFLKGMPLDRWLKNGRKPTVGQVLRLGREIAEGLAAAHERGLIHRDVKPGNIWLDSSHKGRVKILDFGLARSAQENAHLTCTGAIMGTPAYMAPEQARAEKVDARSDLFSFGCVLYELCTGAMPFTGGTTMALLMALALDRPKPVRDFNPDAPQELEDLVTKLLEKDPARRPQTAREVVQALQAVGSTSAVSAVVPPPPTQTASPRGKTGPGDGKRRAWIMAAVAAGFLATAIAAVVVIRDKDGNKIAEVHVPPGGTVTVSDDRKKGDPAVVSEKPAPPTPGTPHPVDDDWLRKLEALPATEQMEAVVAKLKELNPGFDGKETHNIDGVEVRQLTFHTDKVTDISPVRALTGLQSLDCPGSGVQARFANLSPLRGMQLMSLECQSTSVSDLSPLEGMPLTGLNCEATLVSDLTPLKGMPFLARLNCGSTRVSDLSPLKGMPLTYLCCWRTKVSDLSPLKDMPLTVLQCDDTPVSDLTPLKGMPLTVLSCGPSQVSDLTPLKGMKLTSLSIGGTGVSDLSLLKGMPLTDLRCSNMPVSDLSPLKDMKLTELHFNGTSVSDLSPLKDMKLTKLDCSNTKVSDLSPLKEMPLRELFCDFVPERDAKILRSIKSLETINGKPAAEFWKDVGGAVKPPVDDAWLKQVAALPAEKQVEAVMAELKELNPGFDGQVTPTTEGGVVTELQFLSDDVTDISPVRALTGLRKLICSGTPGKGRLADLSPLKGMKLTVLNCHGTQVSDLSPLKDMKLTELTCGYTQVSDLSPLKDMKLTGLCCWHTQVSDLSPLKEMKLTELLCDGTPVSDLSPLKGMPLTDLRIADTQVSDLSPLKGMPLTKLICSDTQVSDLSPLKDMKLTWLDCPGTRVSDLSPLKGMRLKDLSCDFKPERDADILRSIKTLERINGKPAAEFWKNVDAMK